MNTYAVDAETFYDRDYSVETMGVWHYCADPRFEAYLVSFVGDDGTRYVGPPAEAPWALIDGARWVSHHANFDSLVFLRLMRDGKIDSGGPASWHCTADLAAFLGCARNLKDASAALLGQQVSKEVRAFMKGKHWADVEHSGPVAQKVKEYALNDAWLCLELWTHFSPQWPAAEQQLSFLTGMWGFHGVTVDREQLQRDIKTLSLVRWEAEQKIPWAADDKPLSPNALREYCRREGIEAPASMAMDSDECAEWEDRYGADHPVVAAMRDWRRSNMFLAKYEAIRDRIRPNGTMPYALKYFGAGITGRWSGDARVNMQNLPRDPIYDCDLRRCFVAAPGHKLAIVDFAQIEPRVLAWLSGDQEFLERVRAGQSPYEAHARATMGWTGGPLKQEDKQLYALAKCRVLALGYGTGWQKFQKVAKLWAGIEMTEAESKQAVADFRESNPRIVRLWDQMSSLIMKSRGEDMEVVLPSGRKLRYWDLKHERGTWWARFLRGTAHKRVYGALLVENLVQAVSRDIFAAALLRLHAAGVEVLWHVHDEVICHVPAAGADEALAEIIQLMTVPVEWMPGLPIAAEGTLSDHYRK
ncbi:MAG: hypothetical protein KA248_14270 [Kiritimatiellae bacterium]|nr:hypothetical protein [Kiritimatiellia bacterium]